MKKHAIIPIFISHRGCPNACVFCNQKAITARNGDVTVSDAQNTIEEWLGTLDKMDIEKEISFFGGSFTGIPVDEQIAFLTLAKKYKDEGRVQKIHCSNRPDYISQEILDNLKEYGMDVIELGVQSFDPDVLKLSKRGHSVDDIYRACELIKDYGFTLGIQLMIGLPGDSYEACMDSVKQTIQIRPEISRLYPTVVIPGTELSEMYKSGIYQPFPEEEMLRIVKDMYIALNRNNIKVIRIGLKSNELIKGETYHEAFGQLVKSSIAYDEIVMQLEKLGISNNAEKSEIIIKAPADMINFAVGHKASNKKLLSEKFPNFSFKFITDNQLSDILVAGGTFNV